MTNYAHLCNRLHLIKVCLCWFLNMNLYSWICIHNLSSIAKFPLLIKPELFPACLCCSNIFILSQSSSEWDGINIVFEIPEAVIAGDFSNFISVRSRVDLLPIPLISKCIYFAKSYIKFFILYISKINFIVFDSYHFQKISIRFEVFTCITEC